jgi:RNA polymerase primary sigma factor
LAKVILSADEEVGLTLLARPGGSPLEPGGFALLTGEAAEAAEAMLLHNMGLIHSVAQRMGGQGLDYEDLVAHGVPGLIRAIELFDPFRGLKFSTYAMHWVRQGITRAIANEGRIIRLPVHVVDAVRQVKAAQERLTVDGRLPALKEIARECHFTVERVAELLRLAPAVVSLDAPVGNDGCTLGDLLDRPVREPELIEVHGLDADDLRALLSLLDEREADVLRRRNGLHPYDESHTLEDIGVVYGVTRERIRQIERNAITNLRILLGLQEPQQRKQRKKRGAEPVLAASA